VTTPIATALHLVEDVILPVLAALSPAGNAAWGVAPLGTVGNLIAGSLTRSYVAQHQDNGGQQVATVNALGWEGEVVIKVLARTDAAARAGYVLVISGMAALTPPGGYVIDAEFLGEVPFLVDEDGIYQRVARYQIRLEVA
jgi:hypothetical protein